MIRIMLVDDSPLFCAQLRSMENWAEHGMTIVSEARNGVGAISAIDTDPPDVILTDINMPLMDGIGLTEHVSRFHPEIPVIALSAYDDFDYVRNSLRKGAQDYLLKHELDRGRLVHAIRKAARANTAAGRRSDDDYARDEKREKDEFYALLLGGLLYGDRLSRRIKELSIQWPEKGAFPVLACVDQKDGAEKAVFSAAMAEMLRGTLLGSVYDCITVADDRLLIIEKASVAEQRAASQTRALESASRTVERFFGVSVSFGVGDWCGTLYDLPARYKNAVQRFEAARFMGRVGFVAQGGNEDALSAYTLGAPEKSALTDAVLAGDIDEALTAIDAIFKGARNTDGGDADAAMLFAGLLHILTDIYKKAGLDSRDWDIPAFSSFDSVKALKTWCEDMFGRLTRTLGDKRSGRYAEHTSCAISYIRKHYGERISLKDIALALNLNDSYLSRLFKADTGVNIVNYINAVRMDEAIRLLENTSLPIKEVACRVGIPNYSHFFTLFKRMKGRTPADCRK